MSLIEIKHPPTFNEKMDSLKKRIGHIEKTEEGRILAELMIELIGVIKHELSNINFYIAQCSEIEKEF